jgi:hypothetical protein
LPSSLRLAGVHMGVACGLIASSRGPVSIAQTGESPIVLRELHVYRWGCGVRLRLTSSGRAARTGAYRNYSSLLRRRRQHTRRQSSSSSSNATAATQQQPTRARSVRASLCLCVLPRVPIIPLITLAFRAGPSRRRRRSWASHSTWTSSPPAGRLQHIPAHAVGPAFWGGEGSGVSAKTSRAKACF